MTRGQKNLEQYKMPHITNTPKDVTYRVGYTATTGNQTGNKDEPGKRSDWTN
ncbi:hypothetical protein [Peribacillus deserti]|uniref:hypothetical protein n=1 Tax=Peribacillus deserti TaxID=673318 RepID=UPI0015E1474E|nr:hypothetical protein [Peribacillus deserti]